MTAPKRGYSWEPFQPANWRALKHGARSPRKLAPLVASLRASMVVTAPWLAVPAFDRALMSWATAEAQCELLRAYLDEHALLDDDGEPRPALAALERAERNAERARSQLGLNPVAWAALYRTLVVSPDGDAKGIEALRQTGRMMLEATTSGELPAGDG